MNFSTAFRGRRLARTALITTVALGLMPGLLLAKNYKLQNATIVPGAQGEVKTGKDRNGNTKFTVEVKHLAKPSELTPPKTTYIVWIQQKGGEPESQGMLKVNDNLEGKFESSTPNKEFDLWITAEGDPTAKAPSGPEVLRATNVTR